MVEDLLMIGEGNAISTGDYRCMSREIRSAMNVA